MELKRIDQKKYAITRQIEKYKIDYDEIIKSIKFAHDCRDNNSSGIIGPTKSLSSLNDYTKLTKHYPKIELEKENEISPLPLFIKNETPNHNSIKSQFEWEDNKFCENKNKNIPIKEDTNSLKGGKRNVNKSVILQKNFKNVSSSNRTIAMNIANEI